MFYWCEQITQAYAHHYSRVILSYIIVDLYVYCKEICTLVVIGKDQEKIGDRRKILELDESTSKNK